MNDFVCLRLYNLGWVWRCCHALRECSRWAVKDSIPGCLMYWHAGIAHLHSPQCVSFCWLIRLIRSYQRRYKKLKRSSLALSVQKRLSHMAVRSFILQVCCALRDVGGSSIQ